MRNLIATMFICCFALAAFAQEPPPSEIVEEGITYYLISNIYELEVHDIELGDVTQVVDPNGEVLYYEVNANCLKRFNKKNKCKRKGGVCGKGKYGFDDNGVILWSTMSTEEEFTGNTHMYVGTEADGEIAIIFYELPE